MRRELQDLFNARMAELMKSQIEATKMTVEAAKELKNIHQQPKRKVRSAAGVAPSSVTPHVPEDLKTMISNTESSVPEMLSVVEATDRSAKDIQRSIKSAIRELSTTNNTTAVPDDDTSHNITEEIAAELTGDDLTAKQVSSSDESSMTASAAWNSGNFFLQNLEDQKRQNKQQYTLIKKRQKILSDKTKNALGKLEDQKNAALKGKDNELYERLLAKERKIRKYYHERKEELSSLRNALQVAERERHNLWQQHKKGPPSASSASKRTASSKHKAKPPVSDDEDTISSSTISVQLETTVASSRPEKKNVAPIKTPLSPKRTNLRKRHSSAEDEESLSLMSHVETSSAGDQSDLEIRVHTLQEDLTRRMKTAARLKKEQKTARRERLKVQEDALKKQIEVYDQLIEQTKADIDASSPPPPKNQQRKIVQPQIKTPKQQSLNESPTPPQQSSIDEPSSTDTIIVSPHKATPTPISEDEEVVTEEVLPLPVTTASSREAITENNLNYSDDFTSSVSISSAVPTPSATPKDKTVLVDAICGQLLEAMIEDTVGKMKLQRQSQSKIETATTKVDDQPAPPLTPTTPTSPRSRTKVDLMQTAFDISSESSDEGMYNTDT